MPESIRFRSALKEILPYISGKSVESVAKAVGISSLVKLASNENPYGPSPQAIKAIEQSLSSISVYPDMHYEGLREKLAVFYGVSIDQIALGNGSDELMLHLAQLLVEPGVDVVMADGTFSTYEKVVLLTGGNPIKVPLQAGYYDLLAMARAVTSSTRLIFLCNPNNPTGTIFSEETFNDFLAQIPESVVVAVDEAYYEYVTAANFPRSLTWLEKRNVVVLRTFSKIYGLASLRIGYAFGPRTLIAMLNERVRLPFNVNGLAMVAAQAALEDRAFVEQCRQHNEKGKKLLTETFQSWGLATSPTEANFIYVTVPQLADDVANQLLREGFIVRPLTSFGFPDALRITIGTEVQNQCFLAAFQKVQEGD